MAIRCSVSRSARRPRSACVVPERSPVMGDLLEPGQWQDEAAADWVFHLPPHLDAWTARDSDDAPHPWHARAC